MATASEQLGVTVVSRDSSKMTMRLGAGPTMRSSQLHVVNGRR